MQQQLISNKLILILGLLIIVFNSFHTFKHFIKKDTIVICNEKSGTTAVINLKGYEPIVIAESNSKDMLSCIGKSLPHYTRMIGAVVTTDKKNIATVSDRYMMNSEVDLPYSLIHIDKNIYFIHVGNKLILVGSHKNISPFTLEKNMSQSQTTIVYMPENSPKIDQLTQKIIEAKGGEFHTLKLGQTVRDLLRRS